MLILDHYAYNIRNIARGGQGNSDDERINIRQIRFWINGYRASGMFETTDFGKDIHPQLIQDLGIVPLTEVDKSDSECPKVDWGCTIKKVKIPKLIDFPDLRALSYVGYLKSRVYPIGDYLYFILSDNDSELEYVNIRGVFENPEDVVTYPTAGCEQKCYNPGADEYPMPRRLYEYVLTKVLRNELNWTTQAINDELNNARLDNAKIR